MNDEALFVGGTLRDRFVAAAGAADPAIARRLDAAGEGATSLDAQRDEAWRLLTAGVRWASSALGSAGIRDTDESKVDNSEAAFDRAQHLDRQLWKLSQEPGFHDRIALLVGTVKQALYDGADLGPIPGGRIGQFRPPSGRPAVVEEVQPSQSDLQDVGSKLGAAVRELDQLGLVNGAQEALDALANASPQSAASS